MAGIFDVEPSKRATRTWDVSLPLDDRPWNIGLIVGPSGSGKSSVLREFFGTPPAQVWPETKSVLDGFPDGMSVKNVTGVLSSVGFSSPPAWLRPFHTLSNGEQFRASLARALVESGSPADCPAVVDEFTSVVDRTVAQVGSAAVAKHVRRTGGRLVAAGCHYDVIDWLQPDWLLDTATMAFSWREVSDRPKSSWRSFARPPALGRSSSTLTI
jgi:ABC-type Mn2+/Zn2+ transport system ATPase subunit